MDWLNSYPASTFLFVATELAAKSLSEGDHWLRKPKRINRASCRKILEVFVWKFENLYRLSSKFRTGLADLSMRIFDKSTPKPKTLAKFLLFAGKAVFLVSIQRIVNCITDRGSGFSIILPGSHWVRMEEMPKARIFTCIFITSQMPSQCLPPAKRSPRSSHHDS